MLYNIRKRVALLVAQPEEYSQSQFLTGFQKKCFELNYDVCIFAMYIKYQNSSAREMGESSIYSLISYDKFDAVVVMADTIQTPDVVEQLEEDIHKRFSGPVLFVDKESKYFPSVYIDNVNPVKKAISHLIDVHGIKDISYLTGKAWHPYSIKRANAYKAVMEEHGLEVDDENVYYGDFWYTGGESLAVDLIKSRRRLPRAIACANDCMALGFAKVLTANGYKIPEDVALIGYDTNDEGKHSPIPLTSAPIPFGHFGEHSAQAIDDLLNGLEVKPFEADVDLFIGGSCGCGCDSIKATFETRSEWQTEYSRESIFSLFNHMEDDLLDQSSLSGLISTIFSNVHQLRSFQSFDICLNPHRDQYVPGTFESTVLHAIECGSDNEKSDKISYNNYFPSSEMLPKIYEPREYPTSYVFMPIYFDDRVFGYSVISYGAEPAVIKGEYRAWMKAVARGFEFYRRGDDLIRSSQMVEDGILRDSLTGLNNYRGFISRADNFLNVMRNNGRSASVLAIDIKELSKINHKYGRSEGDKAIVSVASLLKSTFNAVNCLCFCVGNGEMIAIKHSRSKEDTEMIQDKNTLIARMEEYNRSAGDDPHIHVYYGISVGTPSSVEELETLVSEAINVKNKFKIESQRVTAEAILTEEEQAQAKVVQSILSDNKIAYHFQPIVSAATGDIYAYEALMRAQVSPYIIPPLVIKYAEMFGRIYDVQKITFNNVITVMKNNKELFEKGRKVFINSIPGQRLKEDDFKNLENTMNKLPGSVVVELTEQSEMSDDELREMREDYERIGIDTALDDYGTGYSNVSNLLRYMPKYVKIDRELLSGIENSPQKQHFVREIIEYSHSNNIFALAEGVETSEELRTVIELGADLIQGYYTARPQAEFAESIDSSIKEEIIQYSSGKGKLAENKIYIAGNERNINLANLSDEKISHLVISNNDAKYRDIIITGTPGKHAPLDIVIGNGYNGTVIFENVDLGKQESTTPSIIITEKAKVTLEIKGINTLFGGIRVDEDSSITVEGEGLMSINVTGSEFYGIGNNMASDCGDIILNQNGTITVNGKGDIGVGIGAGGDANIDIRRGEFIMILRGDKVAAMGSINGKADVKIVNCAIDMDYNVRVGVGAGSVYGETNIYSRNLGYKGVFKGDNITAFGTVDGRKANIDIRDAGINVAIRAENTCVIGSSGDLCQNILIYRENVALRPNLSGVRKITMGNARGTARIEIIGD